LQTKLGLCSHKQLASLASKPIASWLQAMASMGDAMHITDCESFAAYKRGFLEANPGEPIKKMQDLRRTNALVRSWLAEMT